MIAEGAILDVKLAFDKSGIGAIALYTLLYWVCLIINTQRIPDVEQKSAVIPHQLFLVVSLNPVSAFTQHTMSCIESFFCCCCLLTIIHIDKTYSFRPRSGIVQGLYVCCSASGQFLVDA